MKEIYSKEVNSVWNNIRKKNEHLLSIKLNEKWFEVLMGFDGFWWGLMMFFVQLWKGPRAFFFYFWNIVLRREWTSVSLRSWFLYMLNAPFHQLFRKFAVISNPLLPETSNKLSLLGFHGQASGDEETPALSRAKSRHPAPSVPGREFQGLPVDGKVWTRSRQCGPPVGCQLGRSVKSASPRTWGGLSADKPYPVFYIRNITKKIKKNQKMAPDKMNYETCTNWKILTKYFIKNSLDWSGELIFGLFPVEKSRKYRNDVFNQWVLQRPVEFRGSVEDDIS